MDESASMGDLTSMVISSEVHSKSLPQEGYPSDMKEVIQIDEGIDERKGDNFNLESGLITGSEFRFGSLTFTSMFDSGNLARVEKVVRELSPPCFEKPVYLEPTPDQEFNLWTRLDAANTEYENGNRSWFYFGVRGYTSGKLIRINIVNMNKQAKLYSQGYTPICRVLPQKPQWERIRDRCLYEVNGSDFTLSFYYRFPEVKGTVYFAFCYPWSYHESQEQLSALDSQYKSSSTADVTLVPEEEIYYHREIIVRSLDGLRVDLVTISSHHGISQEREPRFDDLLFPEADNPRCHNFSNKKVFVLTSRVHPGETPASSVFNGFLNFILRRSDKRAQQLRRQYVFKLIPMLNPDGVVRGHYRTDSRGVNLNRMYLDPVPDAYPSIYAAKSLLVFHHINNCAIAADCRMPSLQQIFKDVCTTVHVIHEKEFLSMDQDTQQSLSTSNLSQAAESVGDVKDRGASPLYSDSSYHRCNSADSDLSVPFLTDKQKASTQHLKDPSLRLISPANSGVAFYIDLHGHASKRGCFVYGNHFTEEEMAVQNLLFPKLIAMNSAHFDFGGCNFTEKNMYTKDKKDGQSKEGSGRVAVHKSIGIIHSYTLECNYNCGRLVNSIASATNECVSPPPPAGYPPRFTQTHFEEVGRALAIAAIDFTESNPWSRIPNSELPSLAAIKSWIVRSLANGRGVTKYNKPSLSYNPRINNRSNSNSLQTVRSEPLLQNRPSTNEAGSLSNGEAAAAPTAGFSFGRSPRFPTGSSREVASLPRAVTQLAPVRLGKRSFSLPSTSSLIKSQESKQSGPVADISHTRSYSLRLLHTLSRQSNAATQVMQGHMASSPLTEQSQPRPSSDGCKEALDGLAASTAGDCRLADHHLYTQNEGVCSVDHIEHTPTSAKLITPNLTPVENCVGKRSDCSVGLPDQNRMDKEGLLAKQNSLIRRNSELGIKFVAVCAKPRPTICRAVIQPSPINPQPSSRLHGGAQQMELREGLSKQSNEVPKHNMSRKLSKDYVKPRGAGDAAKANCRSTVKQDVKDANKNEFETFEKALRTRLNNMDHSASFWIDL